MPLFVSNQKIQELAVRSADAVRAEMSGALKSERERSVKVQELLVDNILALQSYYSKYVGNEYRDYPAAVKAINDKYDGKAEWGCLQTRTVIDLRAAFILGEGIKVVHKTKTKAEAALELEFCADLFAYNELDAEMPQELAKEGEIEGKVALRLFWDDLKADPFRNRPGMPSVRFLSWTQKKYTVHANKDDYLWYEKLTWPATSTSPEGRVLEEEFIYKKFGGRLHDPNDAQPKVMNCLTQIDRLDRALRDLREINHLFASQTPDFQVDSPQQAAALLQWIEDTNWKFGKAIVHIGTFSIKGPDTSGVANLDKEIETNTKLISGTTGIPSHFLGYIDLLSTRATGDNTRELVMASTTRERSIWKGAYEEVIAKAMAMYNAQTGASQKSVGKLDPEKVGVEIPLISEEHWRHIATVLIPAQIAGIISKEYVASQIPNIDMEEEASRQQLAEQNELKSAQAELEQMRKERFENRGAEKGDPNEEEDGQNAG